MSRPNPIVLTVTLLLFGAALASLQLLPGALYIDAHEGDAHHMLDVLFRLLDGERQHIDFVTPLGVLVFLPIALLMKAGLPFGMAFVLAQIGFAALLFPIVLYASVSRLSRNVAYYFGAIAIGLALALTYGTATAGVSVSMHYNRWGWVLAFVLLVIALLPARTRERPVLDGLLIAVICFLMLLIKATYFVCLVPPIAALALIGGRNRMVIVATLGFLIFAAIFTLFNGISFWVGYLADLNNVRGTAIRPSGGVSFEKLLSAPNFLAVTLTGFAAVMMLGRILGSASLLALCALLVGFFYVTYQNYANDPFWLLALPVLLFTFREQAQDKEFYGFKLNRSMELCAIVAATLIAGQFINVVQSPLKHAMISNGDFIEIIPGNVATRDLFVRRDRAHASVAVIDLAVEMPVWKKYQGSFGRGEPLLIGGAEIPDCELGGGPRALLIEAAREMREAGVSDDSQIFSADLIQSFWLYGGFSPLKGGAPWYYKDLTGIENADYVVIPKCAYESRTRDLIVAELINADLPLNIVWDSDLIALFRLNWN